MVCEDLYVDLWTFCRIVFVSVNFKIFIPFVVQFFSTVEKEKCIL